MAAGVCRNNREKFKLVRSLNNGPDPRAILRSLVVQSNDDGKPQRIHVQALPDGDKRTGRVNAELSALAVYLGNVEGRLGQHRSNSQVFVPCGIQDAIANYVIGAGGCRSYSRRRIPGGSA